MKYFVCTLAIFAGLVTVSLIPASQTAAEPMFFGSPDTDSADSDRSDQPVELGNVEWGRDLDKAVGLSKEQSKPIAILFQEVPG